MKNILGVLGHMATAASRKSHQVGDSHRTGSYSCLLRLSGQWKYLAGERNLKTDQPNAERRTTPISQQEKELTEALDFLVANLKMHSEEYHHKTDAQKVKRCESILEEAISELIVAARFDAQWRQVDANFGAFRLARRGSFSFR